MTPRARLRRWLRATYLRQRHVRLTGDPRPTVKHLAWVHLCGAYAIDVHAANLPYAFSHTLLPVGAFSLLMAVIGLCLYFAPSSRARCTALAASAVTMGWLTIAFIPVGAWLAVVLTGTLTLQSEWCYRQERRIQKGTLSTLQFRTDRHSLTLGRDDLLERAWRAATGGSSGD